MDAFGAFAIAESKNGYCCFRFRNDICASCGGVFPDTTNCNMRFVRHEDGWIYGLFCTQFHNAEAKSSGHSNEVTRYGVVRTKDFKRWERLPNIEAPSREHCYMVLHPEFINSRYALYARLQRGDIDAGFGIEFAWTLCDSMEDAKTEK